MLCREEEFLFPQPAGNNLNVTQDVLVWRFYHLPMGLPGPHFSGFSLKIAVLFSSISQEFSSIPMIF